MLKDTLPEIYVTPNALTWRCSFSAVGKLTRRTVSRAVDDAPSPATHPGPASSAVSMAMRTAANRRRSDLGSTAGASAPSRPRDQPASSVGGQTRALVHKAHMTSVW